MAEPRGATSGEEGAREVLGQPTAAQPNWCRTPPVPRTVRTRSRSCWRRVESGSRPSRAGGLWRGRPCGPSDGWHCRRGFSSAPVDFRIPRRGSPWPSPPQGSQASCYGASVRSRRRAPRRSVIRLTNEGFTVTTSTGAASPSW